MTNALVPAIPYLSAFVGLIFLLHGTVKILTRKDDIDPAKDTSLTHFKRDSVTVVLLLMGLFFISVGVLGIYHQWK